MPKPQDDQDPKPEAPKTEGEALTPEELERVSGGGGQPHMDPATLQK